MTKEEAEEEGRILHAHEFTKIEPTKAVRGGTFRKQSENIFQRSKRQIGNTSTLHTMLYLGEDISCNFSYVNILRSCRSGSLILVMSLGEGMWRRGKREQHREHWKQARISD